MVNALSLVFVIREANFSQAGRTTFTASCGILICIGFALRCRLILGEVESFGSMLI
jgi:hypothetical protein